MVHVGGVDLHKRFSQVAVLAVEGEIRQHRLANDLVTLERVFGTRPEPASGSGRSDGHLGMAHRAARTAGR